jgi:ribosomal protein L7/L12
MNLIDKKYLLGSLFMLLGVIYIYLSITQHKKDNKPNKIEVPEAALKDMDIELKNLIAEDKKIEAIKKCRKITGFGLKEAKDYVDNLK